MRVEQQVPLAEPTVNIYNINIAPTTIVDLSLCPTTPVIVNPPQSFDIGVGEDGINIDTGSGPIDSSRGCASDATTEVASSIAQTGFQTAFDDYRPLLAVNDLAGIENDQGLRLVGDGFLSPSIGKQHPRGPFTFKPVLDTQQASCKPTDGVVKLHCTMSKIAFTRQDKSSVMCVGNAVKTHLQSEVAANYVEVVADFPRGTPYDFMEPFAVSGFFSNAREIVIAGTYNIVHIESILKGCVKASSIEMLNFGLTSPIGRLRGMLHLMPLGMGSLKFDCTKTDNSLFVDNIHAIRHFHQRSEELNEKTTNLASLLLIVGDVPIEKELEKAAQTLAYALKPNGTATMLTRQALDDATILALQRTGFTYCGLTDYELPHLQAFRLYEATHSITQVRVIFGFLADNE